jgi:hypothetical protein
MIRRLPALLLFALVTSQVLGCGGSSSSQTGGGTGSGATSGAADTAAAGSAAGAADATSGVGAAGATEPASGTGTSGALATSGVAATSGASGESVGGATAGGPAGVSGSTGTGGTAGAPATAVDASTDAAVALKVFPSTQIVKIMVVGSSNELGTCWRAFLWRELHANDITNFAFVGEENSGPDCGVPGYDMHVQAQDGIIISNLPASTYAGWFKANPPDIILMHFGGADLLANMPIPPVIAAYSTALAQARLVNPNVILLIAQHTPEGKDTVVTLNADIAVWAPQNSTPQSPVIAVDLYTGLLPADFSDGVHLNEAGAQIVADRWYAALKPFFLP